MAEPLHGIVCSLVTPFGADHTPDLGAMAALVDVQVDAGVDGLFVLGTAGEGVLLPPRERQRVLEAVVEAVGGRLPVVAHCGAADTATAAGLARHAEAVGCAAAAMVAPFYYRYEADTVFRHFVEVADAAPGLAHYVYENPAVVGYAVGAEVIGRLVDEVPAIVGVKDTGDAIGRLTTYLVQGGTTPRVFVGSNVLVYPGLVVGAVGGVCALASAVPELFVAMYAAWRERRLEDAQQLQFAAARLMHALRDLPYIGSIKLVARRRGLPAGGLRAPQPEIDESQAREVERRLASLEELGQWLAPLGR